MTNAGIVWAEICRRDGQGRTRSFSRGSLVGHSFQLGPIALKLISNYSGIVLWSIQLLLVAERDRPNQTHATHLRLPDRAETLQTPTFALRLSQKPIQF